MGRIVKVLDARRKDYLHEVTKYAVKGPQLAAWTPQQITTFIDAFLNVRTFGVFGSLYGERTKFKEWFDWLRNQRPKCDCGCNDVYYYSESEFLMSDLKPTPDTKPMPPPSNSNQMQFAIPSNSQFGHAVIDGRL
jgi:hypothetical protein